MQKDDGGRTSLGGVLQHRNFPRSCVYCSYLTLRKWCWKKIYRELKEIEVKATDSWGGGGGGGGGGGREKGGGGEIFKIIKERGGGKGGVGGWELYMWVKMGERKKKIIM